VTLSWQTWLAMVVAGIGAAILLSAGLVRLATGPRWKAVFFCLCAMALSTGGTVASYSLFSTSDKTAHALRNPSPPHHLNADWGRGLPAEKRTEYSTAFAKVTFINWGMVVDYIDADGTLRKYQPTTADREQYELRRVVLAQAERTTNSLRWATLVWLVTPWLGIVITFVRSFRRRVHHVP
jgi:hypothetical protein